MTFSRSEEQNITERADALVRLPFKCNQEQIAALIIGRSAINNKIWSEKDFKDSFTQLHDYFITHTYDALDALSEISRTNGTYGTFRNDGVKHEKRFNACLRMARKMTNLQKDYRDFLKTFLEAEI